MIAIVFDKNGRIVCIKEVRHKESYRKKVSPGEKIYFKEKPANFFKVESGHIREQYFSKTETEVRALPDIIDYHYWVEILWYLLRYIQGMETRVTGTL